MYGVQKNRNLSKSILAGTLAVLIAVLEFAAALPASAANAEKSKSGMTCISFEMLGHSMTE